MKIRLLAFCLLISTAGFAQNADMYQKGWIDFNKNGKKDIYEDPTQDIDTRIWDLINQMTIEEKTAQMVTLYGYGRVAKDELPTPEWKNELWADGLGNIDEPSNGVFEGAKYKLPYDKHVWALNQIQKFFVEETRLGIPVEFSNEGIRGLNHSKATSLPSESAMGTTWNRELMRKSGEMVGKEAYALGYHNVYAPVIDVVRDQRWGRVVESFTEDPYLMAEYSINFVNGMQSQQVAATLKHFAVYSSPKGARDGLARTDPHVSFREMHHIYLYPFERTIKEANAIGAMASYNDYDGVPVITSKYFLTDLLRTEYGMKGAVVSDSDAAAYPWSKHRTAENYKESVRQCVEAGLNIRTTFNHPANFVNPLRELIAEGKISEETINERVYAVLYNKFWEGLFDVPYRDEKGTDIVRSQEHEALSLQASKEAIVLLKNEEGTLPLSKNDLKKVLVVGPTAKQTSSSISRYGALELDVQSGYAGIAEYLKGTGVELDYAKGSELYDSRWPDSEVYPNPLTEKEEGMIKDAERKAEDSDIIILFLGEDESMVGENLTRSSLDLPDRQQELAKAMIGTGKPVVTVLINARPISINYLNRESDAILTAGFPSEFGGKAIAETLFGDYNPGGKLAVTWPRSVGQIELNFPYKPWSQAGQAQEGPNGTGNSRIVTELYEFGYGLSYSKFIYSNLKIDNQMTDENGKVIVSFDVTNSSDKAGDEVVQLYYNDEFSSVIQYEWQLRGFDRVHLKPNESKTITFELTPQDLYLIGMDMKKVVEPGAFNVHIGSSSKDIRLKGKFEYEGKPIYP
ncbi:glycoside hydrolase family 3 N-terminal domain-containing protein [Aureibacter tunicatorum]|uniref:Beta-glucosidase n=1 Tax=Aureibacter tunicatorum TaxID=866807 RepID=A0AAE3XKM8_9BACT|nr:glycoside hydrolase family 3 N-terminal domain-containing protein [Aureibacter tunicatorum]MDR6237749.1 beta-glucosidase [Aureibacter tunicatorum]BDD02784.1 beta-glucosidase [Aureibacter tunicatorum]